MVRKAAKHQRSKQTGCEFMLECPWLCTVSLLPRGSSVRYINPLCEVYRRRKVECNSVTLCLHLHYSADPPHPKKPLWASVEERALHSLVRYCSCHLNIKFIYSRHRVISLLNIFREFPKISEGVQRFPKITEDYRGRREDVSMIHQLF